MGRDPIKLREISRSSGVHIISSTGWYTEPSHTSIVKEVDVETLAKMIADEISVGIDGTGIKAGLIGEVGCSFPLRESEVKVLRAAGKAQAETRASISVHPGNIDHEKKVWVKEGLRYLDIVTEENADPARFILSHSDHPLDHKYHEELLDEGVTLSFDGFGQEFSYGGLSMPNDDDIVTAVAELCSEGYEEQIVLSHDVWMKVQLKSFGGLGYQHLTKSVVPMLEDAGVTKKQIQKMLVENPRRLLSF
jgi:phosphotriesterase-related protein